MLLYQIYNDLEYYDLYSQMHLNENFNISNNIDLLENLIMNLNNTIYLNPEYITSSSGFVIVIIFKNFVIKIFKNKYILDKIIDIIYSNKSKFIVKPLAFINNSDKSFYVLVTNRIIPIIKNTQSKAILNVDLNNDLSILKLFYEISDSLFHIHNQGYCHNDSTLDNIGINNNKFTLFDFNISSLSLNFKNDILNLIKSIKFNIYQNIEKSLVDKNVLRLFNFIDTIKIDIFNCRDFIYFISDYYNLYYNYCINKLSEQDIFQKITKHKITIL